MNFHKFLAFWYNGGRSSSSSRSRSPGVVGSGLLWIIHPSFLPPPPHTHTSQLNFGPHLACTGMLLSLDCSSMLHLPTWHGSGLPTARTGLLHLPDQPSMLYLPALLDSGLPAACSNLLHLPNRTGSGLPLAFTCPISLACFTCLLGSNLLFLPSWPGLLLLPEWYSVFHYLPGPSHFSFPFSPARLSCVLLVVQALHSCSTEGIIWTLSSP